MKILGSILNLRNQKIWAQHLQSVFQQVILILVIHSKSEKHCAKGIKECVILAPAHSQA